MVQRDRGFCGPNHFFENRLADGDSGAHVNLDLRTCNPPGIPTRSSFGTPI